MIAKMFVFFILFQICKLGYDVFKEGYTNARAKSKHNSL
jgi:hypothetical protein